MTTTNLGMTIPTVGADADTWGGELNTDLGLIDAFAGKLMGAAEVSVASAASCDIGGAASTAVIITGTTTITSFGSVANCIRFVRFSGALTLTHNAASLILLGGVNRATAVGDSGIYQSDGSGNWREVSYSASAYNPGAHTGTGAFAHASGASISGANISSSSLSAPTVTSGVALTSGNISVSGGGGLAISGGGNAGISITGGSNSGLNISSGGANIEGIVFSGNGFQCAGFGHTGYYLSTGCSSTGSFIIGAGGTGSIFCYSGSPGTGVRLDGGQTTWGAWSDERLKTPLMPFANALSKVSAIKAGTARFLTDPDGISRSFLSAQSVQKVLPEAVGDGEDGMLILRYTEVIPLLVAAITELKAELEILNANEGRAEFSLPCGNL